MKKIFNYSLILFLFIQTTFMFGQALTSNTTGSFVFTPTGPLSSKPITVFYHIPNGNISTMPILLSFHGDERNASDYRDYWISMANANGFMVFAPEYSETHYPAGDGYQLGNVFDDGDNPSLSTYNPTNEWTFSTVDPLFEDIKTKVSGTQQNYDAWGHSGGAQFLQRFRMYLPNSKLNTAICSNAGWYTVPESAIDFPYGINNGQLSNGNLTIALSKKIIVHLGLNDTDPNSLGLRHNTTVDNQQGLFRLARGRYFFNTSLAFSQTLSNNFNWQREEVTGVGHDPQLMANDALRFLFQTNVNNISYSILDGGFENQSGTLGGGTGGVLVLNGSTWTANTTGNVVRTSVATGGRTGPRYVSLGSTNGTAKNFFSPQIPGAFAPNTTYQIQFWYKSASTTTLDASTVDLYVDNNSATASGTKQSTPVVLSPNVATWTKITTSITTNTTTASTNGLVGLTIDAPTAGYSADFDDFVVYQASTVDTTAPNSPGAIAATGASSGGANVSWASAIGGFDGGGYVVVRYATIAPSPSDDVVQNGIYNFNNTIGAGVVRYIGSGTSFTDSGLSPGINYYYKVYTVDKAFNYSNESVTSTPVQSLATTYYYNGTGLLTDVSSWGLNTDGTGTAPANFTDASQVFEIRNTTAVTLDGVWTVGLDPANGTKVRLGNTDQAAISLTLNSGASIGPAGTGNFDVMPPSSGNQTVVYKNTTSLSLGTISDNDFTVIYDGVTDSSTSTKSFGTISIINGANVTFSSAISINNFSVESGATATFSSTPSIINSVINGMLVAPTNNSSYIVIPSGGSLVLNGTIRIPRLSGFISSSLGTANTTTLGTNIQFLGSENLTLGANSTVEYNRVAGGTQTVTARLDYKNLILTGTTPKTVAGTTTVSGTLTVNQTTAITLTGGVTVNGSLSFVLGKITTGNNTLTIGTSGTITGADQSTGWIVGNLKKLTASSASPSFSYAIGDSNNYTPLALTFAGATSVAGGLTAKINIGDHAQVATSGIDNTKSVNKNWILTNDSLTGFGTYSAAFTYSSADIDGISTPANYVVAQYDGSTWSNRTVSGTPTDTATTATGISGFGDFAIGECVPTTTGSETISQCGGTYTWPVNNVTYSASTTEVVTVGCNVATLNLTITAPTTTGSETISQCGGTYTWPVNSVTYSASTTEVVTVGCNTATLNLTITAPTTNGDVTQVQTGGTYTWTANGTTYATSGVYTHVVGCNTATLTLTINPAATEIPTTFPAFCKGNTVATATGTTSLKFYTALTGGLPLAGTTGLVTGKTLFVTETINSVESSPRVPRLITVNVIPATPASMATTDAVLCKYVGTTNTVTYTVATVATATSYLWSIPAGATLIADADATDNVITVNFLNSPLNNITVGGLGTIAARAVNSFDCPSAPRSLVLTAKLPTSPSSLTMTSDDTEEHFSTKIPLSDPVAYYTSLADLQKITKVGPYMGTPTVFTLTAFPAPTAASYAWSLPSGATQLSGGNGNIITADFAGVPAGIGALPVVVRSSGGCGLSSARTLTLGRTVPGAPKALILTNTSQSNLSALTKITKVGPYTGTSIQFTLTATPFLTQGATSTSYAWILPAGVTCETTNTPTNVLQRVAVPITVENPSGFVINSFAAISTPTNVITVNFNGATGTGNLELLVFGVNGAGNSIARKLVLARALPTAPTKLVLTDPSISTTVNPLANIVTKVGPYVGETTSLTLTATPFAIQGAEATSYTWTLPAGVTVTAGATLVSGNTWTSTGTVLTVNFDGVAPAVLSLPLSVQAVNGAGTSATTRTLTVTSAAPTTPSAITTPSSAIPTFNPACSGTITVQVLNVFGVTYAWNVGGTEAVITGGQGTNSITIDVSAVTTTTLAISVVGSNGTGNSPTRALTIKKAATCREASTSIANEFSVIAYPNPSSSEFTIKSSAKGAMSVKVYDMQGRLVEKANTDKVGSKLAAGAYNVIVNQGAKTKTLRVIKK